MGCLPLADLHNFRLTKRFPKTPSAIYPIGTPSAFCIDQIVPGFVVYHLNRLSTYHILLVFLLSNYMGNKNLFPIHKQFVHTKFP